MHGKHSKRKEKHSFVNFLIIILLISITLILIFYFINNKNKIINKCKNIIQKFTNVETKDIPSNSVSTLSNNSSNKKNKEKK